MKDSKGILFSIESNLTLTEYKKMFRCIPQFYWYILRTISVRLLLVVLIISLIYKITILSTIILYVAILLIVAIIYKIKIEWLAEKVYKKYDKEKMLEKITITDFYNEFLIKRGNQCERKISYLEIDKVTETESNFYIQHNKSNTIVNIQKSKCTSDDIDFIRQISNSHIKVKERKKNYSITNKESIRKLLLVLFILTLISVYGAAITLRFVSGDKPSIISNEDMWFFWLWLPIPITSIILGFKYKKQGFKCTKNIVAGIIVGVSLLAWGSFTFIFPSPEINYNEINSYKEILKVRFPEKGILTQESPGIIFDDDKVNMVVTKAFYKKSDNIKNFEEDINNREYWINASEIKNELKLLIPLHMQNPSCEKCYFLIFNQNTNEYNKIPDYQGEFHIYTALYNFDTKTLTINDFSYVYK